MTTSTNATEPALNLSAIFIIDSPAIEDEWSQLANTTYMDAGRLDLEDWGLVCAPVFSSFVWDAEDNRLLKQCSQCDEMLSVMSVFAFATQSPDRLDAQRFRIGFSLCGWAFKIRHGDGAGLSTADR